MEDLVTLIFGIIFCVSFTGLAVFFIIMAIRYDVIRDTKRAYYLSTLDEHDKAVLNTYAHIKPTINELFGNEKEA